MFVYLDESGDLSPNDHQGASHFFGIALVLIEDPLPLHQEMQALRASLQWPDTHEFKFRKSTERTRQSFFDAVRPFEFRVNGPVVQKLSLDASAFKSKGL